MTATTNTCSRCAGIGYYTSHTGKRLQCVYCHGTGITCTTCRPFDDIAAS